VVKEGIIKAGDPVTAEKYTGETISIVEMYREHYVKDKSKESLQKHLNAPIDIRSRRDLEEELNELLVQK
jgi:MOSC domain-containing protein YiiM